MIVAHRHQHTAVDGTARHIGVSHHIAGPVYAWTLAVPHAKDAIIFAFAAQLGLLCTPKGCCRQIFV